jgi:hypothetical protein
MSLRWQQPLAFDWVPCNEGLHSRKKTACLRRDRCHQSGWFCKEYAPLVGKVLTAAGRKFLARVGNTAVTEHFNDADPSLWASSASTQMPGSHPRCLMVVTTTADNGSLSLFQNTRIRSANHSPTATQIDPGRLALRSMRRFAQSRRWAQEPRRGPTIGA